MRRVAIAETRGVAALLVLLIVVATGVGCRSTKVPRVEIPGFRSWFTTLDGVRLRDMVDADRRVRQPLPSGYDHFGQSHRDVVLAVIPDAVSGWRRGSVAGDALFDEPDVLGIDHGSHAGFDLLNRNGVFVAATGPGRRDGVLSRLRISDARRRGATGVPAFVVVDELPKERWPVVVVTAEIVVRFRSTFLNDARRGTSPRDRVDRLLRDRWDAMVLDVHPADPRLHLIRVRADQPRAWLRICRELRDSAECDGLAEPNLLLPREGAADETVPAARASASADDNNPVQEEPWLAPSAPPPPSPTNDPLSARQWHLEASGALAAWARGGPHARGDPGVIVAILEPNGVEVTHPDLAANQVAESHWNFDDDSADPQMKRFAPDGSPMKATHGTATAGIVSAVADNGIGVTGIAPDCRYMAICLGPSLYDDVQAIDHAWTEGASVISNSWSYPTGVDVPDAVRCAVYRAVTKGRDGKGCVVLFSLTNTTHDNFADTAGWDSPATLCADLDLFSTTIASATFAYQQLDTTIPDTPIWRPLAALPEVMAIGRCTDTEKWGRCGYGDGMSLVGPSNAQGSTKTRTCDWTTFLGNADVVTTDLTDDDGDDPAAGFNRGTPVGEPTGTCACADANAGQTELHDGDYTVCFRGTSAAVPMVAGAAALVMSEYPDATGADVRALLESTAVVVDQDAGGWTWNAETGRWYSAKLGFGRVSAGAACAAAAELRASRAPRVSVAVSGPRTATEGDEVTLYLTVRNLAAAPIHDVVLYDELPRDWVHLRHSGDAAVSDGAIKWPLGTLAANGTVTMTVTSRAVGVGAATTTAEAGAAGADTATGSMTVTVGPRPVLAVSVVAPKSALVGFVSTWTVVVTNTGTVAVTRVRLDNPYPAGITADRVGLMLPEAPVPDGPAPPRPAQPMKGDSGISWDIGTVAPGATRQFSYTIRPAVAGVLENSASVTGHNAIPGTGTGSVVVEVQTH